MSEPSNNFVDYISSYYSVDELTNNKPGVNIVQAYTNSLFSGANIDPNANIQTYLPGNRYFINTPITCSDPSNGSPTMSILIDNVNGNLLANPQKQGLIYSMLTSLSKINPVSNFDPSHCRPVSVYINGSNTGESVSGWVSSSDYDAIDPQAIDKGNSFMSNPATITPATTTPATTTPATTTPATTTPATTTPATTTPASTTPATTTPATTTPATTTPATNPGFSIPNLFGQSAVSRQTLAKPPFPISPFIFGESFTMMDTPASVSSHDDPMQDRIVQLYLFGLVVLSGYIVYRATFRK